MLELEEGPRVLGLGLGLFLLVLLWSSVLLATLVCSRLSAGAGAGLAALAAAITAIMVSIPRHPPRFEEDVKSPAKVLKTRRIDARLLLTLKNSLERIQRGRLPHLRPRVRLAPGAVGGHGRLRRRRGRHLRLRTLHGESISPASQEAQGFNKLTH